MTAPTVTALADDFDQLRNLWTSPLSDETASAVTDLEEKLLSNMTDTRSATLEEAVRKAETLSLLVGVFGENTIRDLARSVAVDLRCLRLESAT